MCNHLETLGIGIVQPEGHSVRRSYLASMAHGLTAYDASYIELALQRGAALATLDRRLADVARATGLTILS
jgi:predicted nucleic acid-binding protein